MKPRLTSDQGHVVEHDTEFKNNEPGERYRKPFPGAGIGEVVGGRVRYGIKKYGYHGEASPQECVVPVVVLAPCVFPATALFAVE